MHWWGWLLTGWASLATLGGLLLGGAAKKARRREREWRHHQYETASPDAR